MLSLRIAIHSFVDLITNSSSEVFISADQDTVNTVKKLVNTLLTAGGGKFTADDLFTFELDGNDLNVTAKDASLDVVLAAQTLGISPACSTSTPNTTVDSFKALARKVKASGLFY